MSLLFLIAFSWVCYLWFFCFLIARIQSLESELHHIGVDGADKQIESTQLKEAIGSAQQQLQQEIQKVESKSLLIFAYSHIHIGIFP